MPRYRDEDKGIFHEDGGIFHDDPEETAARLTAAGSYIPVECKHCGDEMILEIPWAEVVAMGQHAPVKGWARTPTGYLCNTVCERCHTNYASEGWGAELSEKEAAEPTPVTLSQVKGWLKRGRKFARRAMQGQGVAPGKGAPVGWQMRARGMVGGIPCKRCGSVATVKVFWQDVVRLVRGQGGAGWDPHGNGFVRPLHCPACKAPVPAFVSMAQLNKWLRVALRRKLVK